MSAFLEITTNIGCKNVCKYCPQSLFLNQYKSDIKELSLDNYILAIDKLPDNSTVTFAGFSEPCDCDDIVDMILYANSKNHNIMLLTTLVGLTVSRYEHIKHIDFKHFSIHLPDNDGKTKVNITQEYVELLSYIIANPPNGIFLFNHHSGDIHNSISHLVSHSHLLQINDRAGSLESPDDIVKNLYHGGNIKCNHQFLFNHKSGGGLMLPNGDVYLCCSDFGLQHKLGNLLEQSWEEIIQSDTMNYVLSGLADDSKVILCRKCFLANKT
jgi:radical SAM protein with 4Fe4S-binding SPASM domain